MLQNVLRDMYIDPELLDKLQEIEKETLFCCMRAEQIRRWKQWDQKQTEIMKNKPPRPSRVGGKSVKWLLNDFGEPRVDVIDSPNFAEEIQNSKTDDNKVVKTLEQKELRLSMKDGQCVDLNKNESNGELSYINVVRSSNTYISSLPSVVLNFNEKRGALQELSLNKVPKVARQVAEWEKRVTQDNSKLSTDNISSNDTKRADSVETVSANEVQEQQWREQQKRAKETESRIRRIARIAREEHRRSLLENQNENEDTFLITSSANIDEIRRKILKPPTSEVILDWYRSKELPKGAGLIGENRVADWFHGLVSRKEAEMSLSNEKEGTYLVRISERLWSYTVTCKTSQGIKHYLIDASSGCYQFLGNDQISHSTLEELITYHKTNSLMETKNEFLLYPCLKPKNVAALFGTENL